MKKDISGGVVALGCLAMLLVVPVMIVASIFIGGFVVQALWEWFAVPLGVPNITMFHAAGIATLVGYLCPFFDTSDLAKKEGTTELSHFVGKVVALLIFRPACTLFCGWLIKTYFMV